VQSKSIYQLLLEQSVATPDAPALLSLNLELSYSELVQVIVGVEKNLVDVGVKVGSKVATRLSAETDWIVALALNKIGAVSLSLSQNGSSLEGQIDFQLVEETESQQLVIPGAIQVVFEKQWLNQKPLEGQEPISKSQQLFHSFGEEDISRIFLTSGTTGEAKAVCLSQAALFNKSKVLPKYWFGRSRELGLFPLSTIGGFGTALAALATGKPYVFSPATLPASLAYLSRQQIEAVTGSPDQVVKFFNALQKLELPFQNLKIVRLAGGPVSKQLRKRLREMKLESVKSIYGSTECGGLFVRELLDDQPLNFLGEVVEGSQLRIKPKTEGEISLSVEGEIEYKTQSMFSGYLRPDGTLDPGITTDGFFAPGDQVELIAGKYSFLGREDDLLNIGGVTVNALTVEEYAKNFPGVSDALAIVVTDPSGINWLALGIVADFGLSVESLTNAMNKDLPGKAPKYVAKVNSIPRTQTGKPIRRLLAEIFEKSLFGN
jgi:long-chain acyl-CoA synthetase